MKKILFAFGLFYGSCSGSIYAQDMSIHDESPLLGGYSLGIELAPALNLHVVEYDESGEGSMPRACEEREGRNHCWNIMTPNKINSFGVFVAKQYVPNGFLVFDHGFDFSFRRYEASLVPLNSDVKIEQDGKEINLAEELGPEQTLQNMNLDAYNLAARYFIKAGLAPPILPDILLSTGIGVEAIYGTLAINDERFQEVAFAPHYFLQMELVWARFLGKGSFSTYLDMQFNQTTNSGRHQSIKKDGMENFQIHTASLTLGIARLVFPM